jgi:Na+-transporting NADH:ubiquinone oxidoreductase subunit C
MRSNAYTLGFAAIVTLICSVLLASASTFLKERQDTNIELDRKMNILKAFELIDPEKQYTPKEVFSIFDTNLKEAVTDLKGNVIEGKKISNIGDDPNLLALYLSDDAYCIPISGKGLWSTIKGYLAFEKDLNTVKGLTFYSHGETPGLGGEIEKDKFTKVWKGKTILDESGNLVSITIVKGKIKPDTKQIENKVDGISGATLTGKGINIFVMENLKKYQPYFSKQRGTAS